jgi:hypothetical protein
MLTVSADDEVELAGGSLVEFDADRGLACVTARIASPNTTSTSSVTASNKIPTACPPTRRRSSRSTNTGR